MGASLGDLPLLTYSWSQCNLHWLRRHWLQLINPLVITARVIILDLDTTLGVLHVASMYMTSGVSIFFKVLDLNSGHK